MNTPQNHALHSSETRSRTHQDHLAQQRALIEFFSNLPTRIVRSAYAGQVTARPDPLSAADPSRRSRRVDTLSEQLAALERGRKILEGHDPDGEYDRHVCGWVQEHAEKQSEMRNQLAQAVRALQALYESAADHLAKPPQNGGSVDLDRTIKLFIEATGNINEQLTTFCAILWQSLDEARKQDVNRAERARVAIDGTLAKLEKIGKHVRLVSLNASVEASRAGDAGKGLAVIAIEFKSLAEEIQGLAATARRDIEELS